MQGMALFGEVPYRSYNYNYWEEQIPAPVPYKPEKSISGEELGIGQFLLPTDLVIDEAGDIYVLDAGNKRIVILDEQFQLKNEITSFQNAGVTDTFKNPNGICISREGILYVADTDNNRIVALTTEGQLVKIIEKPTDAALGEAFVFNPIKVAVDDANRIYVVAKNVFEGLMSFDDTGKFTGYFGTIKVQVSPVDWFWRKIATKEQRAKMQLFIPTEFTNLDIDDVGFIYATNIDTTVEEKIRRLNPSGKNVLVNYTNRKIIGDIDYRLSGPYSGPSHFIDIKYRGKGIYSGLDRTKGKIFTYDSEGNLLYIFGGMGTALGMFKKPVAVECAGETLYVLDETRGEIIVFSPTEYGASINTAVGLRYDGDEVEAVKYWEKTLKLDSHYELAYSGIGKSLLAANKNKEAMAYLKKGMDKKYYSVAFKRYRNEVLKANISKILLVVTILVAVIISIKFYKKTRGRGKERDA